MDALFEMDPVPRPIAAPKESSDVRRTKKQFAELAAGRHPLTGRRLHLAAAPYNDRSAEGRRCGDCRFRELVHGGARSYAKCLFGWDGNPRNEPPRATHGAATDCRAWWPACPDHDYADAVTS